MFWHRIRLERFNNKNKCGKKKLNNYNNYIMINYNILLRYYTVYQTMY